MSRARHHGKHHGHKKHHAEGGRIDMKVSGNPDVFKEADEKHGSKKKGGRVHHMHGHHPHHRGDRPGRKKGGRVGANDSPLSTAHHGVYTSKPAGSPSPDDTYVDMHGNPD